VARLEKELARLRPSGTQTDKEYRDLVENVNSIILRMDIQGNVTYFNEYARRFFGYGNDEILGKNVVGTIVPESESTGRDLAALISFICRDPEQYAVNENENMKKDGTRVWISWSNRAVTDKKGAVTGILCVGNDITGLKKAETAAREIEERYRVLFDSSVNIIYLHDFQGNFIDSNEAGLKFLGYSREEIKNLSISDVLVPADVQKAIDNTNELIINGFNNAAIEYSLRTKTGEIKHVEVVASVVNRGGRPYAVQGIARDVTEQKKTLEALRESEEKFFKAFNRSPLLIALSTLKDGRFIDVNDRFLELTGFGRDEVIGNGSADLKLFFDNEERAAVIRDLQAKGSVRNVGLRIRKKSGEVRWGLFSADILQVGQNELLLTMMSDVTEGKRAEEDLRENEAVMRSMLEAVPVGVGLLVNRKFKKVNRSLCAITGFSEKELLGSDTRIMYPDDGEYERIGRELYEHMAREGLGVREAKLQRKDGRLIDVLLSLSPIDPEDLNAGVTAAVLDITERKRSEMALRASEEKFRLLAENARDVIWLTDLNLKPLYVSKSIMHLCGYTPEEVMEMDLEEMLPPRSRELALKYNSEQASIEQSGTGDPGRTVLIEMEFKRKDGSTVWTESIVAYQRDLKGHAVAIVGVSRDISERRISQAENEAISRISRLFLSPEGLTDIYNEISSILNTRFGFPVTGIVQYDRSTDEMVYLGSTGIPWKGSGKPRVPASEFDHRFVETGNSIAQVDISTRDDYSPAALAGTLEIKSLICEPIVIGGRVFGAVVMGDRRIRPEVPRIARIIRIIADYLSGELSRRRMEETLRESEELTRNLMASVNEGIIIFGRDLRILLWNRFMEELTGIPAGEVIGNKYAESYPHVKYPSLFDDMKRSLAGESFRSEDLEYEFIRSGRKGWLIGQYTPLRNAQEEVVGIIVSIRDITHRKMVEMSLGRTQEELRETLDATTDGIWTWNASDNDYYYSPRFYTMLGYEPGEFPPSFDVFKSLIHPDDREQALATMRNYLSSGKGDMYENEYRFRAKDGSYRWIYSRARVVERNQEGRVMRMIGNHEDITDRKIADERLKGQLAVNMALAGLSGSIISQSYSIKDIAVIVQEYARLLTESEEGYVSELCPDTGGNIILSSTMKMPEGSSSAVKRDIGGKPLNGRKQYGGLWGYALNTRQAFFTNDPPAHESWVAPPPGHPLIKRFLSVPVLFYNELVGQIALANSPRDYTENDLVTVRRIGSLYAMAINRIRNENRIMASLHEKEVLIKELHHRVKNNMQVVSSLLALQSRKVDDERYRKYFEESQNRIHAMAMVHEKLYHSEDMARVDFSEYIRELTRHLFYTYNINRQAIRLHLDVGEIYLGIDTAIPCAMIINELVSNSLEHAFTGGREGNLTVQLQRNDEGMHTLTVSDDGVGIPEDFTIGNLQTLGMQIIQSLTRQIRGTLEMSGKGGTHVTVIFNGIPRIKGTAAAGTNGRTENTDR